MSLQARKIYEDAIVIDGLNVSNWESEPVFQNLRIGNFTAINATAATWENFLQTMSNLTTWMKRSESFASQKASGTQPRG